MTTVQYGRKFSMVIGDESGKGLDFAQFKVVFQIRRGDLQTPNTADVRIYNLTDNTANRIGREFTTVTIQAGYEGNFGLIFRGNIKQVRKGREDASNSYVDVTAADGDEAYNFATISMSLAAGAKPADEVQAFLQNFEGITKGYIPTLSTNGSSRGRVFYGTTRDELREFAEDEGVLWSIQDGRLTMIPQDGWLPGTVPVISSKTGLVGVPEQSQGGIELTVLLNPLIRIGQRIQLVSDINLLRYGLDSGSRNTNYNNERSIKPSWDGMYYVMQADHSGDTRGNDWYTHLTCLSVDATMIPDQYLSQQAIFPDEELPRF